MNAQRVITTVAGAPNSVIPPNTLATTVGLQPTAVYEAPTGEDYIVDAYRSVVLKISTSGVLTLVAGNGITGFSGDGGLATNASLSRPLGVAVDGSGNLYISDNGNGRIRKVTPDGIIRTFAGNGLLGSIADGTPALQAGLPSPQGVAVDQAGNLYLSDNARQRVFEVTSDGKIKTVAGNGTAGALGDNGRAVSAQLNGPFGIAVDSSGNLFIADELNNRIRKVSADGTISTVVGTGVAGFFGDKGPATAARLDNPTGVAVADNGIILVADFGNHRVRAVTADGTILTLAGNGGLSYSGEGGLSTSASLSSPSGVAIATGGVLVADFNANRVLRIAYDTAKITTIAGNGTLGYSGDGGPATSAGLGAPAGLAVDASGNLYIADYYNSRVRRVTPDGVIQTFAGNGVYGSSGDGGQAAGASLMAPYGLAVDAAGNLYISDFDDNRVRKVSPSGIITTFAGNGIYAFTGDEGPAASASLRSPTSLAVDGAGNVFIADFNNQRIRKVTPDGNIHTFAGTGSYDFGGDEGPALKASFRFPFGLALDGAGNLYISDRGNNRVRQISPDGMIHTVAGTGESFYSNDEIPGKTAALEAPEGLAVDADGTLYIAEQGAFRVRSLTRDGLIHTVAGNGGYGFSGDGSLATRATFRRPRTLAIDSAGNLYIGDSQNFRVRKVLNGGIALRAAPTTVSLEGQAGGPLSASAKLLVFASVPGIPFSVTSTVPWLTVTPTAGVAPAVLQVQGDPATLAANSYAAVLTISSPLAAAAQVNVSFAVAESTGAHLAVDPTPLRFSMQQGGASTPLSVAVTNTGSGTLGFSITPDQPWVSVSPANGSLTAGQSITVSVSTGSAANQLAAGTYSAVLTITSTAANQTAAVPVVLSVTPAAQHVALSQAGITFAALAGGGKPLSQTFGILNTGSGSMNWTAVATAPNGSNVPWLSLNPASGTVATPKSDVSQVGVTVDPAGLAVGDYYAQIRVRGDNADNSPQIVTVAFRVVPADSALPPDIQPSGLIFTGAPGSSPSSREVRIGSTSPKNISYVTSSTSTPDGVNWLQYQPSAGTLMPNQTTKLTVQPDFSNLPAGTYNGTINFGFDDGSVGTVKVLLVVAVPDTGSDKGSSHSACGGVKLQYTGSQQSLSAPIGQPMSMDIGVADLCGHPITTQSGYGVFGNISNGDHLNFAHLGGGQWQTNWTPPPNVGAQSRIAITALPLLTGGSSGDQITLYVNHPSQSKAPFVPANGVAYNATKPSRAVVAPGSLISIYGAGLADNAQAAASVPLGTALGTTEVRLGDTLLPLQFAGPAQINAQVPMDAPLNQEMQLIVRRQDQVSVATSLTVAATQPALFSDLQGRAIVTAAGGTSVITTAKAGDVLVFYGTGLGAVNPAPATGGAATGPASVVVPVTVSIGGKNASLLYAGLTPGFPGLYQINLTVPAGIAPGSVDVVVTQNGTRSDPVTLTIQ